MKITLERMVRAFTGATEDTKVSVTLKKGYTMNYFPEVDMLEPLPNPTSREDDTVTNVSGKFRAFYQDTGLLELHGDGSTVRVWYHQIERYRIRK